MNFEFVEQRLRYLQKECENRAGEAMDRLMQHCDSQRKILLTTETSLDDFQASSKAISRASTRGQMARVIRLHAHAQDSVARCLP